jgi:iron-sulfur cluster assembly protein
MNHCGASVRFGVAGAERDTYNAVMSIELTESAARRVEDQILARGKGEGLRVAVKTTGCSGFAYVVDFADEIAPDDQIFESHGVRVVVDSSSLELIAGTVIDFRKEGLAESFQFDNPKVTGTCGCGESFSVN